MAKRAKQAMPAAKLARRPSQAAMETGYLTKQGGSRGGSKNWKKRFMVLDTRTMMLRYFGSEKDYAAGRPKGEVEVVSMSDADSNRAVIEGANGRLLVVRSDIGDTRLLSLRELYAIGT